MKLNELLLETFPIINEDELKAMSATQLMHIWHRADYRAGIFQVKLEKLFNDDTKGKTWGDFDEFEIMKKTNTAERNKRFILKTADRFFFFNPIIHRWVELADLSLEETTTRLVNALIKWKHISSVYFHEYDKRKRADRKAARSFIGTRLRRRKWRPRR